MAALIVGGAVGSYFGVVNGLGALLDRPPAPAALPMVSGDSDVTALGTPRAQGAGGERAGRAVAGTGAGAANLHGHGEAPDASVGLSAGRAVGRATPTRPVPTLETTPDAPAPTPGGQEPDHPTDPAYPPYPTDPADPSAGPVDPTPASPWPSGSTEPLPPADPESTGESTGGSTGESTGEGPAWEPNGWENRGRWDDRGASASGAGRANGAGWTDRGRWSDRTDRWAKPKSGGMWTRNDGAFHSAE
jgi:hypothetical protein